MALGEKLYLLCSFKYSRYFFSSSQQYWGADRLECWLLHVTNGTAKLSAPLGVIQL